MPGDLAKQDTLSWHVPTCLALQVAALRYGMLLNSAGIWTGTELPNMRKEEEGISIESVRRRGQRDSTAMYFPEHRVKITGFEQTHQR